MTKDSLTSNPQGDPYSIPGGEICKVCGLRYYRRSFGGPGICPACDCGDAGPQRLKAQRDEIERLTAERDHALARVSSYQPYQSRCDIAEAERDRLRAALEEIANVLPPHDMFTGWTGHMRRLARKALAGADDETSDG